MHSKWIDAVSASQQLKWFNLWWHVLGAGLFWEHWLWWMGGEALIKNVYSKFSKKINVSMSNVLERYSTQYASDDIDKAQKII